MAAQAFPSPAYARMVASQLPVAGGDVARAVRLAVDAKATTCHRALPQVTRRLYATANLVWFTLLHRLPHPLPLPPRTGVTAAADADHRRTERVFTDAEVEALIAAAGRMMPTAHLLVLLLFTTGLRIAAAANVHWSQLLTPAHDGIVRAAVVRENQGTVIGYTFWCFANGNRSLSRRATRAARSSSHTQSARPSGPSTRLRAPPPARGSCRGPCGSCATSSTPFAERRGSPDRIATRTPRATRSRPENNRKHHSDRSLVAHQLFRLGNSVATISKFLGHRSIQTTSVYYLQLGFEELVGRMRLPWGDDKAADAEEAESPGSECGRPSSPATCASCGNPRPAPRGPRVGAWASVTS